VKTGMLFDVLEPVKVKGKEGLIPIFRPTKDTRSIGDSEMLRAASKSGKLVLTSSTELLMQTNLRRREQSELLRILESFYRGEGGMLLLTGEAGSGKTELATMVTSAAANFGSRLIESLSPKSQNKISDVMSRSCLELSQVLRGLLALDVSGSDSRSETASSPTPTTIEEWRNRLKARVGSSLWHLTHLFDEYFKEWVSEKDAEPIADVTDTSEAEQHKCEGPPAKKRRGSALLDLDGDNGGNIEKLAGEDAKGRLLLLSAVLDAILTEPKPLMIFIHVRTGSSLSAGSIHPEMWGLLRHLSNFATDRYLSFNGKGTVSSFSNNR